MLGPVTLLPGGGYLCWSACSVYFGEQLKLVYIFLLAPIIVARIGYYNLFSITTYIRHHRLRLSTSRENNRSGILSSDVMGRHIVICKDDICFGDVHMCEYVYFIMNLCMENDGHE